MTARRGLLDAEVRVGRHGLWRLHRATAKDGVAFQLAARAHALRHLPEHRAELVLLDQFPEQVSKILLEPDRAWDGALPGAIAVAFIRDGAEVCWGFFRHRDWSAWWLRRSNLDERRAREWASMKPWCSSLPWRFSPAESISAR